VADVDADGVPTRVYRPAGADRTMLFAHGGGFVFGEPDTHDAFARRLANATGSVVVLPDYRRAPEDPFPAAVEDVRTAWGWLDGADLPGRRVLVGDSAGGNLALSLALSLALEQSGSVAALVLVYPFVDPSMQTYAVEHDNDDLSLVEARWYWSAYAAPDQWSDPLVDPLLAPSFRGLPRTLVQLAGADILLGAGERLVERLRADGVDLTATTYAGVPHGFWRKAAFPESYAAVAEIAAWLDR
jgi:acetyl esterase